MGIQWDDVINRNAVDTKKLICSKCQLCLESPVRCSTCRKHLCRNCDRVLDRIEVELDLCWCIDEAWPARDEDMIECSAEIQQI